MELTLLEGVIHVQECEMVTVEMGKALLGIIGGLFELVRAHETLRD